MSPFEDRRERAWSKVCLVVLVSWCLLCKGEANQNGLNNQAQLKKIGIDDNTVKIKHKDPLFAEAKLGFGFGLSFFHLQLFLFSLAFFSWQSLLHYTMRTFWNIFFPLTIITAGTYNSLRPAMATVGTQTWAVGLMSLKALKQTTKIPKYSWYGLQLLLLAPLRLINVKSGKKKNKKAMNKLRRQSRNRLFHAEEGSAINQDDDDDEGEQYDSDDDEAASFMKTSVSEGVVTSEISLTSSVKPLSSFHSKRVVSKDAVGDKLQSRHRLRGYRRGCMLVFKRPTQQSFLTVYRTIPLRFMSRVWGRLMQIRLPKPLRKPIIYIYSTVYGCNLTEIQMEDVSSYTCLGEFFRRRLRPDVRPVDAAAPLTSPADGRIVRSGLVQDAKLEQIKGVTYSLPDFLGAISWKTLSQLTSSSNVTSPSRVSVSSSFVGTPLAIAPSTHSNEIAAKSQKSEEETTKEEEEEERKGEEEEAHGSDTVRLCMSPSSSSTSSLSSSSSSSSMVLTLPPSASVATAAFPVDFDVEYQRQLCVNDPQTHKLHHLVVYLAPGDYHRFHSPADWTVTFRRHFPGDLFSVAPLISRWISGLFNYNERVLYAGFWDHGFFSMTAVGATGVGSIRAHLDPSLSTNEYKWNPRKENHKDLDFTKASPGGIRVSKGEEFGEFNLGSTIVLVFEAPNDFRFQFDDADKVQVGQGVGAIAQSVHIGQGVGAIAQSVRDSEDVKQSVSRMGGRVEFAVDDDDADDADDDLTAESATSDGEFMEDAKERKREEEAREKE